jgi:hypothetical protein
MSSLSTTAIFNGVVSPYADVHTNMENLSNALTAALIVTSTTTMTLAGSGYAHNQTVSFVTNDPSLAGGTHTTTYDSLLVADTADEFATGLYNAINADTTINGFVTATHLTDVITLVSTSGATTTYSASSNGGSETYTTDTAVNTFGPGYSQVITNNDAAIQTIQSVLNTALILTDLGTTMCQPGSSATVPQVQAVMADVGQILSNTDFTTAISTLSAQNANIIGLVNGINGDVTAVSNALIALP